MIYTVTFNPSLDYVIHVMEIEPGNLHRAETEELFVGGKGINVSAVLKELGVESTAFGFAAGFTGREIINRLNELGISSDFVSLNQGFSRINVKIIDGRHEETEVNGQGPAIEAEDIEALFDRLNCIEEGDFIVLSGSVPADVPDRNNIYARICDLLKRKKLNIIVDAEQELLLNTLTYKPFLIKPNYYELEQIFGRELIGEEDIIECAKALQDKGAKNVLVSMAGQGAILIDMNKGIIRQKAPIGKIANSVGAGDAMIAGFIKGLLVSSLDLDYNNALKYSVATGSASAFSSGYPKLQLVEDIYRSLE